MSDKKRFSSSTVAPHDHNTEMVEVNRVAAEVRQRWGRGESPNLIALLGANPDLKSHRSIFLDLAHEEFCRRTEAGERLDADEFCRQFPSFQSSLCMLIEVNRLLDQDPRCRAAPEESVWPKPGESFLDYSLIEEIGRGSFARVFMASEPALGDRLVVLKVAPHGGAEAELAGRLRHPNIVPVHSIKEDPATGLTAICMPYLGRTTLCDVLDYAFAAGAPPMDAAVIRGALVEPVDDSDAADASRFDRTLCRGSYVESVLRLAVQIADALAYTHARGICHRDLKPSNVLLSVEGRPLLLDFNLSADGEANAWQVGGTLPYMAPEHLGSVANRLEGRALPPDPRSDIFSLGVIIYQLLCGKLPFGSIPEGSSLEQVAERLLERQRSGPRPLRAHNRQVDRSLEKLIEACLSVDPDRRPQSTTDLAASLRAHLTVGRRARRWVVHHPRHVIAAATAVMMVVLAVGTFLALRDPYSVREFSRGLHYARQQEYQLALRCLDRSLETKPDDPEALFARGRVRLKLGLDDSAAIDFYKAWTIKPSGELLACQGFCASRLVQYDLAAARYRKALQSGFETPSLLNNLGNACLLSNRDDEAEQHLLKAAQMRPDLQAVQNNLLILHVRRAVAGQKVTESMLAQAKRALKTAEPSGQLYCLAATLFGRAAMQDPRWKEPAREYVRLAMAHRANPRTILSDRGLTALVPPEEIQALSRHTAANPPLKPVTVVDPLDGESLVP